MICYNLPFFATFWCNTFVKDIESYLKLRKFDLTLFKVWNIKGRNSTIFRDGNARYVHENFADGDFTSFSKGT